MTHAKLLALLLVTLNLVSMASPAKILFLIPLATKSETQLLNPMAKGLLARGHQVTFVSPANSKIKHGNMTEINPIQPLDFNDFLPASASNASVYDIRGAKDDLQSLLYFDFSCMGAKCHEIYKSKEFAPILEAKANSYDLVVTSCFFNECFFGLIHKLKVPYIIQCSMRPPKETLDLSGMRTPLSFVPNPMIAVTDKMTLYERMINALSSWSFVLFNRHHFHKIADNVAKQYLGEDIPSVESLLKNVSLVFTNTHFSLTYPRPSMPDQVEIAGVQTEKANPLPKDLEEFCSGGKDGFILFSIGTVFPDERFPPNLVNILIKVFSKLKVRVLWKWRSELKGLPSNVKVVKWVPQSDVLGHPNIKLFISHGGMLSTTEATYHGVPVLGIPLLMDQDANMRQAEDHGYALKLEIMDITEELLETSIKRMLNEPSFSEKAKLASQIFRDQPQTPLERAVYWMEYVIRYKGAPQLRSSARDLSYIEYHLYDVEFILLSIVGVVLYVAWKIVSFVLALTTGSKGQSEGKSPKRKAKKDQ